MKNIEKIMDLENDTGEKSELIINSKENKISNEVLDFEQRMTNLIDNREKDFQEKYSGFKEAERLSIGELFSKLFSIKFFQNEGIKKILDEINSELGDINLKDRDKQKYFFKSVIIRLINEIGSQIQEKKKGKKEKDQNNELNSLGASLLDLLRKIDENEIQYQKNIDFQWIKNNQEDITQTTFSEREANLKDSLKQKIIQLFRVRKEEEIQKKEEEIELRTLRLKINLEKKKEKLEFNLRSNSEDEDNEIRKDETRKDKIHLENIERRLKAINSSGTEIDDPKIDKLKKELEEIKHSNFIKLETKEERELVNTYRQIMSRKEEKYEGIKILEVFSINSENREKIIEDKLEEYRKEQTILRSKLTERERKGIKGKKNKNLLKEQYKLDFQEKYLNEVLDLISKRKASHLFKKVYDRIKNYFKHRGIENITQDAIYSFILAGTAVGISSIFFNDKNNKSKNNDQLSIYKDISSNINNFTASESDLKKEIDQNVFQRIVTNLENNVCKIIDWIPSLNKLQADEIPVPKELNTEIKESEELVVNLEDLGIKDEEINAGEVGVFP